MNKDAHSLKPSGLLFQGYVEHARFTPCEHRFRTGVHFYAFDVSALEQLDVQVKGFGFNRFAPVSIRNEDYLSPGTEALSKKLVPWLEKAGITETPARIWLVTSARWFGKIFNPVSFYVTEDAEGTPTALISEVNNTFGDRHIYSEPLEKSDGIPQASHAKEFHVSPFNDMEGQYRFTYRRDGEEIYIGVDLYREGEKILEAWMEGEGEPLTSDTLWKTALRHPFRPWLTMPRIVWQAILLKYKRKLMVFKRPEPSHPHTIRSRHHPISTP